MIRRVPYRLLVAAAAISSVFWSAGRVFADDGYLLKRVYKVGESDKFKTTLKIESGSADGAPKVKFDVTILGTETVKEVKADGSTVLETKLEKSTVNFGGNEREIPGGGQTITTVIDKDGRVLPDKKAVTAAGPNPTQMLAFTRSLAFPDKMLKPGDEQKFEYKNSEDGKETNSVKGVMTVVRLEKKSADLPADAIKVKVVMDATIPASGPAPTQQIHVDGFQFVEPGTGRIVLATGTVTGFKLPQLGEATVEFKRARVTATGDAKPETGK